MTNGMCINTSHVSLGPLVMANTVSFLVVLFIHGQPVALHEVQHAYTPALGMPMSFCPYHSLEQICFLFCGSFLVYDLNYV